MYSVSWMVVTADGHRAQGGYSAGVKASSTIHAISNQAQDGGHHLVTLQGCCSGRIAPPTDELVPAVSPTVPDLQLRASTRARAACSSTG
jgi:hypothetical protein